MQVIFAKFTYTIVHFHNFTPLQLCRDYTIQLHCEYVNTKRKNIFEKKLLIYLFLLEKYYFCSVFNNKENKMKALYNTYFFFFYYFYFSNKVKREFVCVR